LNYFVFKIRYIRIFSMSKLFDNHRLDEAFGLLSDRLRISQSPIYELIVCGGSSLIARGVVSRVTRDVDVIARRQPSGLVSSRPLPPDLLAAADRVAADLDLAPNWLNDGPADLFELGLPEGCIDRLDARAYGSHLVIWYIGRLDQIHFKLYAAADQGPGRHVHDLLALQPTAAELLAAARWAFTHDVSLGFRATVKDMLAKLGYERIAAEL
jgi:hypothetical protein